MCAAFKGRTHDCTPTKMSEIVRKSLPCGRRPHMHGKKREHRADRGGSGLTRGGSVLTAARGGGLLRAINACKLNILHAINRGSNAGDHIACNTSDARCASAGKATASNQTLDIACNTLACTFTRMGLLTQHEVVGTVPVLDDVEAATPT